MSAESSSPMRCRRPCRARRRASVGRPRGGALLARHQGAEDLPPERRRHRFDAWPTPLRVGSLAPRKSGGFIGGTEDGIAIIDPISDRFELVANPEEDLPDNRFNDGKVDRRGRFWAGTMDDTEKDSTGTLYRVEQDLGAGGDRRRLQGNQWPCVQPVAVTSCTTTIPRDRSPTHSTWIRSGKPGEPARFHAIRDRATAIPTE